MSNATLPATPTHPTLLHPRTGTPLRAIGFRPDGRPLWPILGGDGTEDDANDWAKAFEGKTPAQVKQALEDAQSAASKGDDSAWSKLFGDDKPEDVKQALEESRKWESRSKANKPKADQFDNLVKLITGKDDAEADPEKLTAELSAAQRQSRDIRIENHVLRNALKHEANGVALTDSRSFMDKVRGLDPDADDFSTKVADAIKAALEDDDRFAATVTSTGTPKPVRQQGKPSETGKRRSGSDLHALMHKTASAS